jgi:hypothetical protein
MSAPPRRVHREPNRRPTPVPGPQGVAARLFAEIAHAAYAQRARDLVAQLEG